MKNKIDIIYSVLVHESSECLLDLISNIIHFNKKYNIKIIVNSNYKIYQEVKDYNFSDSVILNHKPKDKVKYSYDILGGHVENFIECESLDFSNYIPIASNCMFFKQIEINEIEKLDFPTPRIYEETIEDPRNFHIKGMLNNSHIAEILNNNGIKIYDLHRFHEGAFYAKEQFKLIKDFLLDNKIHESPGKKFIAEETLLPLLEMNFFNRMVPSILNMISGDIEKIIEDSNNKKGVFLIKPISREINCNQRIYLRNLIGSDEK
jgi:hypothetical protein